MAYHEEYENALGTPPRKLSRVAKIVMALGAVFLIGAGALAAVAVFAVRQVANEFEDLMENPATVVAARLVEAAPDLELVSSDVDNGTVTFRNRSTRDVQTVDAEDFLEGRLDFHTDDGDFSVDLRAGDEGGVLVIRGEEGEVFRLDLNGDEDGGKLVVTTDEGEVFRMEAHGDEDGGEVTARTPEGEVFRLHARGDEDGGTFSLDVDGDEIAVLDVDGDDEAVLRIRGENGTTTLRGIEEGGRVPGFVPEFRRGVENRTVYQADADEGRAGAVRFETSRSLEQVMAFYADELDMDGDSESARWNVMGSEFRAAMAREDSEGRTVTVIGFGSEDGPTHVVVTWADPN